MNRNLMWRGIIILAVVAFAVLSGWPPGEEINLGLDLRGGMHLVLDVEVEDALRAETERNMQRVARELGDAGVPGVSGERLSDTSFALTGIAPEQMQTLESWAEDELVPDTWRFDREGDRVLFELTAAERNQIETLAVTQALTTIRNRIDQYGVAEPVIQRVGLDDTRILVQLPGVDDPDRVRNLIKSTAFLEFKLVDYPMGGRGAASREEILAHYNGRLPANVEIGEEILRDEQGQATGRQYYALQKETVITGRDLRTARPSQGQYGDPVVRFSLNP